MTRFADLRGAGRRGRRLVVVMALPLVLAVLPAIAGAEDDPTAAAVTDHRSTVTQARDTAAGWAGLSDDGVKDRDKAHEHLDKALDSVRWLEDGSGLTDEGSKVFDELEKAAKDLSSVEGEAATWLVNDLVAVAEVLAAEAIAAAAASGADVEKAVEEFDKAVTEEKAAKRIDRFGKAWKEAGKSVDKAEKAKGGGGSGSFGTDHVYTFTMVAPDGLTTFEASGTSGSNEGYLFHPNFGSEDTYLDEGARAAVMQEAIAAGVVLPDGLDPALGGVIQVHVSCSDAFPDGFGAKSDPAVTATWRVQSAEITKGDKNCHVDGATSGGPVSSGSPADGAAMPCFENGYPTADGTYYAFDFVSTALGLQPEVIAADVQTVCGSSERNEGFLFDAMFGPADSFLAGQERADAFASAGLEAPAEGGVMQVHVSCSDAFAGGIGEKSDPAATSQWLVNTAHIVQVKDGAVKKDCEVIGAGIPVVDPPAEDPPADDPPAEDPPADDPPAEDPPADDPPAEDPPADDPPAEDPPADDPPAEDPPADDPPADDPPANPAIDVEKRVMFAFGGTQTDWIDADEFDPTFGAFPGSEVFFEFTVTNSGNVDLADVVLTDTATDPGGCGEIGGLPVGAQTGCVVSGIVSDSYAGEATASGTFGDQMVTDSDWVYYLVAMG